MVCKLYLHACISRERLLIYIYKNQRSPSACSLSSNGDKKSRTSFSPRLNVATIPSAIESMLRSSLAVYTAEPAILNGSALSCSHFFQLLVLSVFASSEEMT